MCLGKLRQLPTILNKYTIAKWLATECKWRYEKDTSKGLMVFDTRKWPLSSHRLIFLPLKSLDEFFSTNLIITLPNDIEQREDRFKYEYVVSAIKKMLQLKRNPIFCIKFLRGMFLRLLSLSYFTRLHRIELHYMIWVYRISHLWH